MNLNYAFTLHAVSVQENFDSSLLQRFHYSPSRTSTKLFLNDKSGLHNPLPSLNNFGLQGKKKMDKNLHPYRYIINEPHKCKEKNPFLVFLIASTGKEKQLREAIRKTWGNEVIVSGVCIVRLFMLGISNQAKTKSLFKESKLYHDIIQQNFLDTYKNLTLKTMMGMNWVSTYCPNASYVMKTDSDMFVNTEHLIKRFLKPSLPAKRNYFTGFILKNHVPHRDKNSKWYVPPNIYPHTRYPSFCSGTGYLFSTDLAAKIFSAYLKTTYLFLEDVFVGICLKRKGIEIVQPPKAYLFNNHMVRFTPCRYYNLITSHGMNPDLLMNVWHKLQKTKHSCIEEDTYS
ncbi:beta-1,3-galactosyltransferase 2-like [Microcaecilia unicolor]|uniref:Hexosyltransferase n=1 Tax=Microcaecilia unicolor TaxID=1415580 RepID=A0A6P7YC74_9AMPH|nr:beta-1,3-galactosyltransferase 2-like [Microcaecilia unicolor]